MTLTTMAIISGCQQPAYGLGCEVKGCERRSLAVQRPSLLGRQISSPAIHLLDLATFVDKALPLTSLAILQFAPWLRVADDHVLLEISGDCGFGLNAW